MNLISGGKQRKMIDLVYSLIAVVGVAICGISCSTSTEPLAKPNNLSLNAPHELLASVGDTISGEITVRVNSVVWENGSVCDGKMDTLLIYIDSSAWMDGRQIIEPVASTDTTFAGIEPGGYYRFNVLLTVNDTGYVRITFGSTFLDQCFQVAVLDRQANQPLYAWGATTFLRSLSSDKAKRGDR